MTETGIWNSIEADEFLAFDYFLAQWIGNYLPKNKQVIDIGCGRAVYLRYLHDVGFQKLLGVEGANQNFHFGNVIIHDLSIPLEIKEKGNVICLEVGEHIPEEFLPVFLDNITSCVDDKLIFSWAIPGQDGEGHLSCRHNVWVINEMSKRGLKLLTEASLSARSVIREQTAWFRNTILIFERI